MIADHFGWNVLAHTREIQRQATKVGGTVRQIKSFQGYDSDVSFCHPLVRENFARWAPVARRVGLAGCAVSRSSHPGVILNQRPNRSEDMRQRRTEHLGNVDEIEAALVEAFGRCRVRVVDFGALPILEQWCLAGRAHVLIGQHGAALVNAVFLEANRSGLIEIGGGCHEPDNTRCPPSIVDDMNRGSLPEPLNHGRKPNFHYIAGFTGAHYRIVPLLPRPGGALVDAEFVDPALVVAAACGIDKAANANRPELAVNRYPAR